MTSRRILVVDDEPSVRSALRSILSNEGYDVREAMDGKLALGALDAFDPDLVLTDIKMPEMDGLTLLHKARERGNRAQFVFMTANAQLESAVEALRAGAAHYLVKPIDMNEVLDLIERSLETRRPDGTLAQLIGKSPSFRAVLEAVRAAASAMTTLLVLGERGTGKDLIAETLHAASSRAAKSFVKVACAQPREALVEVDLFGEPRGSLERKPGKLELADGGTLYLDDVDALTPGLQTRLLRVLQSRTFEAVDGEPRKLNVRIVASSERALEAEVKAGRFSEDLLCRLNPVAVTLPPLRQRASDLLALVEHFVALHAKELGKKVTGIAVPAREKLLAHTWPGNLRELDDATERAVRACKTEEIAPGDLPVLESPPPAQRAPEGQLTAPLYELERQAILRAVAQCGGSTTRAAELLGISVRKIQYRLKDYAAADQSHAAQAVPVAAAAAR